MGTDRVSTTHQLAQLRMTAGSGPEVIDSCVVFRTRSARLRQTCPGVIPAEVVVLVDAHRGQPLLDLMLLSSLVILLSLHRRMNALIPYIATRTKNVHRDLNQFKVSLTQETADQHQMATNSIPLDVTTTEATAGESTGPSAVTAAAALQDGAAASAAPKVSASRKSLASTETDDPAQAVLLGVLEPAMLMLIETLAHLVDQVVIRCPAPGSHFPVLDEVILTTTPSIRAAPTGAFVVRPDRAVAMMRLRPLPHLLVVRMDMVVVMSTEAAAEADRVEEGQDPSGSRGQDLEMNGESHPCARIGAGSAGARRALDRWAGRGGRRGRGVSTGRKFTRSTESSEKNTFGGREKSGRKASDRRRV